MRVVVDSFWAPKEGNDPDQYEDAFWPYWPHRDVTANHFRFAVADGATESAFSRLWARMLVLLYCSSHTDLTYNLDGLDGEPWETEHIRNRASRWAKIVNAKPLPWFAIEKAQRGSFASLLGLTLLADTGGNPQFGAWQSIAIGDTCLFQIREGKLRTTWPMQSSSEFNSHPFLVSTDPNKNRVLWRGSPHHVIRGEWRLGDVFYLVTDALAARYLAAVENGESAAKVFPGPNETDRHFRAWLTLMRQNREIRNDDVTLLRIEVLDCR